MDKIVKGYPNWDIPLNANIDEYNTTMGNAELSTEDKTVKGAINEIKTGNDETIKKIKDDTQINTADISNLKTSVAQNTSSLNDNTQNITANTNDITILKGEIKMVQRSTTLMGQQEIEFTNNINNLTIYGVINLSDMACTGKYKDGVAYCTTSLKGGNWITDIAIPIRFYESIGGNYISGNITVNGKKLVIEWSITGTFTTESIINLVIENN